MEDKSGGRAHSNYIFVLERSLPGRTSQVEGYIRNCLMMWEEDELEVPLFLSTNGIEQRKHAVINMVVEATDIVFFRSTNRVFSTVLLHNFSKSLLILNVEKFPIFILPKFATNFPLSNSSLMGMW